jgi:hypothetical protein
LLPRSPLFLALSLAHIIVTLHFLVLSWWLASPFSFSSSSSSPSPFFIYFFIFAGVDESGQYEQRGEWLFDEAAGQTWKRHVAA